MSVSAAAGGASRLGCYVVPGATRDPRQGVDQARAAEGLGLGTVWIGERYDTKDLPSLAGALSQATHRLRVGAGITHTGTRHPMALASMGQTLQALSGGRFLFGFGRSASWRWKAYGLAAPTSQAMADTAGILRRLWAGETVTYRGPAGHYPELRLGERPDVAPPPLLLAAVGPRTLALAGRAFDGVILHPFLTPAAVSRSVAAVRAAAQDAGRDPAGVRCYAIVVVAPDRSAGEVASGGPPGDVTPDRATSGVDIAIGARAAGYFHVDGLGDALVRANGWDPADLARYRSQPALAALAGRSAGRTLRREQLVELSRTLPDHWLPSSSAVGDAATCVARLQAYLDAGADELVLHGSTPANLGDLVAAFAARQPAWG
jgi:5,10-methylenetetrahydromethanopterin reductase